MRAKAGAPWAGLCVALALMASAAPWSIASPVPQAACQKIVLWGEVSAGQEWKAGFGQGWVFRVLPIDSAKTPPGQASYSGWDLVVDREQPAGFPDALLMATPPYESINEREVGTTFGLRAQDSIGWNPRSFRFLTESCGVSRKPATVPAYEPEWTVRQHGYREKHGWERNCGWIPGNQEVDGTVASILVGTVPDSGRAAHAGYCRCCALCRELGDSIGQDTAQRRGCVRGQLHSAGDAGLDAVLHHVVAAGDLASAGRAACRSRRLFGVRMHVLSFQDWWPLNHNSHSCGRP